MPIRAANCLWLILPLLVWNALLWNRLPARYGADVDVPSWLVYTEHGLRVIVFVAPLLLSLGYSAGRQRLGVWLYLAGLALYFCSWLPQLLVPDSLFARHMLVALAPAYSPALLLAGIAVIGSSRAYGAVSAAFVAVHCLQTYLRLIG